MRKKLGCRALLGVARSHWKIYLAEIKRSRKAYPGAFDTLSAIRFFPKWCASLHASPIEGEQPWIVFACQAFLEETLTNEMRVCEFGSGGSTLFFAKRVGELVTVENDPAWVETVKEEMKDRRGARWELHVVPSKTDIIVSRDVAEDPDAYTSHSVLFGGQDFKEYATVIDRYPDGYFDVVLVDGRARPSCCKHSIPKVKEGGFLILDNSDRDYYHYANDVLTAPGWSRREFAGPGPSNSYFSKTTAWRREQPATAGKQAP